jgi:hypothetical protein
MHTLTPFLLALSLAEAQPLPHNRITFSGGWSPIELEASLFTAFNPAGEVCSRIGCIDVDDRFYWVPFRVRFIAPLYFDRIEFSAGGGGPYEKYTRRSAFARDRRCQSAGEFSVRF